MAQHPNGSQLGADDYVLSLFPGRQGYFVEVGAADGIQISNTYKLEQNGWRGLAIDPLLRGFESRKCTQVRSAVYSTECMVQFATCAADPNFSGITDHLHAHREYVGSNLQGVTMLPAKPLAALLAEHSAPRAIEFLSIDTEGSEYEILRVFPFDQYKFAVIAVEHNFEEPKRSNIRDLLTRNGYRLQQSMQWDDWYVYAGP